MDLLETSLKPLPLPSDVNLLPLNNGDKGTFRWRNSKYMKAWSTQSFNVSDVVNSTARVDVKQVSGPLRVAAAYALATRRSGVTLLSGSTQSASAKGVHFPALGHSRRFVTPLDLMVYGFNPVVPAPPANKGASWRSSRTSRDFSHLRRERRFRRARHADREGPRGQVQGDRHPQPAHPVRLTSSAPARGRPGSRRARGS